MLNLRCLPLFGIGLLLLAQGTAQEAPTRNQHAAIHWGYEGADGPSHWGSISAEFAACNNGRQQSPIDISHAKKVDLPPIRFDYRPAPLHIIDNGHTIMINYTGDSSIRIGDRQYELKQFHFHRPSEEKINGKSYDMVVHLVHADPGGNLAVVAVLLERGADNSLIHELWTDMPKEKDQEEVLDNVSINAADLLPADRSLLHLSRFTHDTPLHRKRNLVRIEASRHVVCGRDQAVWKTLST